MKKLLFLIALSLLFADNIFAQPSHQAWNDLLKAHVQTNGKVDYKGFLSEQAKLDAYLKTLSEAQNPSTWSEKEQLAYWINVYNAFTVKAILNHYPVKSIMDIKPTSGAENVWKDPFFSIGGKKYTLNDVEHEILRKKFNEPRIHFAINCASISCPDLRNEAFTANKLEEQLEEQTKAFINNPSKNKLSPKKAELSQLFSWFESDFTKNGTLIMFLNQHYPQKIAQNAKMSYLEYDWGLNGQ